MAEVPDKKAKVRKARRPKVRDIGSFAKADMAEALVQAMKDVQADVCHGIIVICVQRNVDGVRTQAGTRLLFGGLNGLERIGALATALSVATTPQE